MSIIIPKEITDIHKKVLKVGTKIEYHKNEIQALEKLYKELETKRRKAINKHSDALQPRLFQENRVRPIE